MKKRSECDCLCHNMKNGITMIHIQPCCFPDNQVERSELARDEYYKSHSVCPECGGDPRETTTMGVIIPGTDINRTCCSVCEWKGIVHNLVAKPQ